MVASYLRIASGEAHTGSDKKNLSDRLLFLRFTDWHDAAVICFALALPLAYLNTLYYMQGFEESGQLVRMILGILRGIGPFMVILTVCMIGFAFAFFVLYDAGPGEYSVPGSGDEVVTDAPYGMQDPFFNPQKVSE